MITDILPAKFAGIIENKIDLKRLYEIRVRLGLPIMLNFAGSYYFLGENGLSSRESEALLGTKELIEAVMLKASNYSVYAVNGQLKQGFITTNNGIRIGVSGEVVSGEGEFTKEVSTIKNFSSLNIRVAHEIKGCALPAVKFIMDERGFKNCLVIAPPGAGKTTFLRDLAAQLSNQNLPLNVLILDERFEIASAHDGRPSLSVGKFTDVLSGAGKQFGFEQGIRAMRPDVIFTDEIANKEDAAAILSAARCGVKVAASVHASGLDEFRKKPGFESLLESRVFERYIVLSSEQGPGTYEAIFDQDFKCLFCR